MLETPDKYPSDIEFLRSLRHIKIILLIVGLGLLVVGKRVILWPLVNWPMYSDWRTPFPESSRDIVELRIINDSDQMQRLLPSDILPFDRKNVAELLIEQAFFEGDTQSRRHNRAALTEILQSDGRFQDARTVQAWRVQWTVQPLSLPPLDRDSPRQETLVGSFEMKDALSRIP